MKVTAQTIGYKIEFLGTWEKSLQPLVDSKEITKEQMEEELRNQKARAKAKRNQPTESQMNAAQKREFLKQKKKLAKPLHNLEDHEFVNEIYFERVAPEYLREVLQGKPQLER